MITAHRSHLLHRDRVLAARRATRDSDQRLMSKAWEGCGAVQSQPGCRPEMAYARQRMGRQRTKRALSCNVSWSAVADGAGGAVKMEVATDAQHR